MYDNSIRERSGSVRIDSCLVSFLYQLMRDHLPTADVEDMVKKSCDSDVLYSNGWLALYANDVANRLLASGKKKTIPKFCPDPDVDISENR